MIKEAYCSYEVSKLLKERGFECEKNSISAMYDELGMFHSLSTANDEYYDYEDFDKHDYIAPTHQMAMAWLREEYNTYIIIQPDFPSDKDYKMCWCWSVNTLHENCISMKGYGCYIETYEEAVEAALKYCLENLI